MSFFTQEPVKKKWIWMDHITSHFKIKLDFEPRGEKRIYLQLG